MSINLQSCMLSIRWWQKKHPGIQKTSIIIHISRRWKKHAYSIRYSAPILLICRSLSIHFAIPRRFCIIQNFLPCKFADTLTCRSKMKEKKYSTKNIIFYYSDPTNVEKIIMLSLSHNFPLWFSKFYWLHHIWWDFNGMGQCVEYFVHFFFLVVFHVLLCYSSRIIFLYLFHMLFVFFSILNRNAEVNKIEVIFSNRIIL